MTAATFEQVHAEFTAIVEAMPADYAYPRLTETGGSLYVHGGYAGMLDAMSGREPDPLEPGCIVAHWLHRSRGVPLECLATMEGISGPSVVLQLMATDVLPIDLLNDDSSAQLLKFLQMIQACQDTGASWREALETSHKLVTTPPWSLLLAPEWKPPEPPVPVDA